MRNRREKRIKIACVSGTGVLFTTERWCINERPCELLAASILRYIQHRGRNRVLIQPVIKVEVVLKQAVGNVDKVDTMVDGAFERQRIDALAQQQRSDN